MKLYLKLIIISMVSFIYAECSEIDNQEDCERAEWCEWSENAGCIEGEWDDDDEGDDDQEWPCEDIESQLECEYSQDCEWINDSCESKDDDGGAAVVLSS